MSVSQPTLLCVHMPKERQMRLSFLALSLGVSLREVTEAQQGQPLGALCGLDPLRPLPGPARVEEEMLVMAFFPDPLMDRLLPLLRRDLGGVRLKAVLTPTNRNWTCGMLYAALTQEAAQFKQGKPSASR